MNLPVDIKKQMEEHFSFLTVFGFKPFAEQQLAHEYHFTTSNNKVVLDISYEQTYNTAIWVTLNGLYVAHIEPENENIREYYLQLDNIYGRSFQKYLATGDEARLAAMADSYASVGSSINNKLLKEISEILKRHPELLQGDLKQLEINANLFKEKNEKAASKERKKQKVFTLEIDLWNNGEFDATVEFESINAVKDYLNKNKDIANYRLLDSDLKEINLET